MSVEKVRQKLRAAATGLNEARASYEGALFEARRAGLSNCEIARQVGRTEAAVRMYLGRREQ